MIITLTSNEVGKIVINHLVETGKLPEKLPEGEHHWFQMNADRHGWALRVWGGKEKDYDFLRE